MVQICYIYQSGQRYFSSTVCFSSFFVKFHSISASHRWTVTGKLLFISSENTLVPTVSNKSIHSLLANRLYKWISLERPTPSISIHSHRDIFSTLILNSIFLSHPHSHPSFKRQKNMNCQQINCRNYKLDPYYIPEYTWYCVMISFVNKIIFGASSKETNELKLQESSCCLSNGRSVCWGAGEVIIIIILLDGTNCSIIMWISWMQESRHH